MLLFIGERCQSMAVYNAKLVYYLFIFLDIVQGHHRLDPYANVIVGWSVSEAPAKMKNLNIYIEKPFNVSHLRIFPILKESNIGELLCIEDVIQCILGRLLLRHAAHVITGTPWEQIEFKRTEKGKPYLSNPSDTKFGMNITHQGDYVGFASSCTSKIGVDLMRLDKERKVFQQLRKYKLPKNYGNTGAGKTADDYINSMAKSASLNELRIMRSQPTESMKMTMFYRYWCLKEAILKATGEGILDDLSRIDFQVDMNDRYRPGCFLTSTTVLLDGKLQDQWIFEETFVDGNHAAAVCKEKALPRCCLFRKDPEAKLFFSKVSLENLLEYATIMNPLADNATAAYENLINKPRKTF
ncbi:4'-phosphopantetheinyl transferase family protein [Dictyocaulus viviparus]|uniref:L-aminoadipate-semialdehyde dehydrogenase-phosphopantetheinyl transferase n=1 Tax=Dictyocaulus viviparus TaxID=29172 RepID=A0A0D8XG39_DICVI|nr:4'-phosphopantetheinyl transferase family protein [Dictyocaulus viviparus]